MNSQNTFPAALNLEQKLMETVRKLDSLRALQVLDFARWLETQPAMQERDGDLTPEQLAAEEVEWEQAYEANRDEFRAMARRALQEFDGGETTGMAIVNGKLEPQ